MQTYYKILIFPLTLMKYYTNIVMLNKNMFLRDTVIRKDGKEYRYWRLVKSYRDKEGEIKQKTIVSLGKLSPDEVLQIKTVLSLKSSQETFVTSWENIQVKQSLEFLQVGMLANLWEWWGFNEVIDGCTSKEHSLVKTSFVAQILTINRCLEPNSDRKVQHWYNKTILPKLSGITSSKINPTRLYRTLDEVLAMEPEIQKHIYKKIRESGIDEFDLVFYDITSTYFEGDGPDIAEYGHSRDHRGDKKQVLLALAVTKEGFPFWWRVLPGNTVDSTTVKEIVGCLKKRFELENCAFIMDKGMVTDGNLEKIEDDHLFFIVTLSRDEIRSLPQVPFDYLKTIKEDNLNEKLSYFKYYNKRAYYKELESTNGRRYILCFNPEKFREERKNREEKLSSIEEYFSKLNKELRRARYSRDKSKLEKKIYYYLRRRKATKFFEYKIKKVKNRKGKGEVVTFFIDVVRNNLTIEKEEILDGVYVLCSNLVQHKEGRQKDFLFCPEKLIRSYRHRIKIERAFHQLKAFVDIRPIYHHKDERVQSHIFICVLAYLLNATVEYLVRKRKGMEEMTAQSVYENLESCKAVEIEVRNVCRKGLKLTEFDPLVEKLITFLSSKNLLLPEFLRKIEG